ncbi:hypothetical protein P8452_47390 [Trifolium repens]|nr:hypothetical protein P8452_47390 [Trifolium repens]
MTAWFVESSSRAVEVFYLKFNRSLEASITISTGWFYEDRGFRCSSPHNRCGSCTIGFVRLNAGDFEEAVEEDAKTAVQDGTIYDANLKQLFQEFDPGDPESQLPSNTTRIMQALE